MHFIHREGQPTINLGIVQSFCLDHFQFSSLITFKFDKESNTKWRFENPSHATETYEHILKLYSEIV